jgi:hypothetical protein
VQSGSPRRVSPPFIIEIPRQNVVLGKFGAGRSGGIPALVWANQHGSPFRCHQPAASIAIYPPPAICRCPTRPKR